MERSIEFNSTGDNKINLTDVKLVKENSKYYLSLKYEGENIKEKYEMYIPRVELPLPMSCVNITEDDTDIWADSIPYKMWSGRHRLLMSNGSTMRVLSGEVEGLPMHSLWYVRPIETKTQEMTLEEIEKKLGHKVKIVNK